MCTRALASLAASDDPRILVPLLEALAQGTAVIDDFSPLLRFGEKAVSLLLESAQSDSATVRAYAIYIVSRLCDESDVPIEDPRGFLAVVQALKDVEASVRCQAVDACCYFEQPSVDVLPLLIAALQDPEQSVRNRVIVMITSPPFQGDRRAQEALIALRKDPNDLVRAAVLVGLNRQEAPEVVSACLEAMDDANPFVRKIAWDLLGQRQEASAIPHLVHVVKTEEDEHLRKEAERALFRFGDREMVAIALLSDPQLSVDTKLETLIELMQIRLYGIPMRAQLQDAEDYCHKLLQEELAPITQEAIQVVVAEITARRDSQSLLRGSEAGAPSQVLLRGTEKDPITISPGERECVFEKVDTVSPSRPSWFARLRRKQP